MTRRFPISILLVAMLLVSANAITCGDGTTVIANCDTCAASTCTAASAGYKLVTGGASTTQCTAGTYATAGNTATTCTSCAAGTSNSNTGSTSSAACTNCAANYYSAAAASVCTACTSGQYSVSPFTSCSSCATGCSACTGSTGATCTACSGGYYFTSGTGCTQCAANTYYAGGTATSCTACASGTISSAGASYCSTPYTTTLTSSAFSAPPGKVFDGSTGAADVLTWGTYDTAWFGPGTTNTTVYAYAYALGSGTIAKVVSRTLNATILANGTADTSLASKVGDDAVYGTATTITSGPAKAVGPGSTALAYAADDSTGCNQVYIQIFNGGTASPAVSKAVTANTCSHCTANTASTGTGYSNSVGSVFYDNGTYWVAYTSKKYVETETLSGGHTCTTGTSFPTGVGTITTGQVFGYLQGVTTNGSLAWTAASAFYTGTASAVNTVPSPSSINPKCSSQNYTNSTNFLCTYSSSSTVNNYITVAAATGTAGSAATISTDVAATSTYPNTAMSYSVVGFVYGPYQQGILLNNYATTYTAASTSTSTNTLQFYNLTTGATATAGGVALTGFTNTYDGFTGLGLIYSTTGYVLIDSYATSATARTYEYSMWFANGTANGTKTTFASGNGGSNTASYFVDAKGALWAGAYGYASYLQAGYLGKVATLYNTFGNIFASFFALLSLVIAALLAF